MAKLPPPPWFDPKTGIPTQAFYEWAKRFQSDQESTNITGGARIREAEIAAAEAAAAAAAAAQAAADLAAASPFSAAASPTTASGSRLGAGSVTTNSVTLIPTGGTGPYTYAHAYVSGDATLTTNSPTSAASTFTGGVTAGVTKDAVYRGTITDSLAATATVTYPVTISENS